MVSSFPSGPLLIQGSVRLNFGELQSAIYTALAPYWVESAPAITKAVL